MKYTREQLEKLVLTATSFADICRALQIPPVGSSLMNIKRRIIKYEFDISHFNNKNKTKHLISNTKKHHTEWLVNKKLDRRLNGRILRRAMIEAGKNYECEKCLNKGFWNNQKLLLEVDHIDGDWKNNELQNLRFLCPNCHSQTHNFGCRKKKLSKLERSKLLRKQERPSLESLKNHVEELGFVGTGKKYGVSDNAIRKWIRLEE